MITEATGADTEDRTVPAVPRSCDGWWDRVGSNDRQVLVWEPAQLRVIAEQVAVARAGQPAALLVEGGPGMGKSALLNEILALADGFSVVSAGGTESRRQAPYELLAQWGVDVPRALDGSLVTPFVAAQMLRVLVDEQSAGAPLLLLADDLQWADQESVEALTWLLRRTSGERLLVCVASRPLPAATHSAWTRWAAARGHAVRITLAGLSPASVSALARRVRPGLDDGTAERLAEHTDGNPLYLSALLEEFDPAELAQMRLLPAPAEFVELVGTRLQRVSEAAIGLLRAVCVLDSGWVPLTSAAAVAGLTRPAAPVQELLDAGLLQARSLGSGESVRVAHSLIRSAVYQRTPLPRRQELHRTAASVVTRRSAEFDHRIAAAEQHDEQLADELEAFAEVLHASRDHGQAAQYWDAASSLTGSPLRREALWLESLFDGLLARHLAPVHAVAGDLDRVRDTDRGTLVRGTLAIIEGRWDEAGGILESAPEIDEPTDSAARYRLNILSAWAKIGSGAPLDSIAASLARAQRSEYVDGALSGYAVFVQGVVAARFEGIAPLLSSVQDLPEPAEAVPPDATYQLAFRGAVRARMGFLDQAIADLSEAVRRMQIGLIDIGDGAFHATLGQAYWLRGDWGLARVNFRLAMEISEAFVHPLIIATVPLLDSAAGDFEAADRLLERAATALHRMPWDEAVQTLFISQVVRLHAGGSATDQAAFLPSALGSHPPLLAMIQSASGENAIWLLHVGIASVWAADIRHAEMAAQKLEHAKMRADWIPAAAQWLRGLVAEARNEHQLALSHLTSAISAGGQHIPLYQAHMLTDQARLARRLGRSGTADRARDQALGIYRQLGAAPYVQRAGTLSDRAGSPPDTRPTLKVTGRERDTLDLLITGMSYTQIARNLFVTESTVGFHLGKIYAKAGVSTRHQLLDEVRGGLQIVTI